MSRGKLREVGDDEVGPKDITHWELVRIVLDIKRNYVTKAEFRMLVAGLTVAVGGITTLLVTALNIRSGG